MPNPKYIEIAQKLEQYIIDNNLEQGAKLPIFTELLTKYQISKSTLVKAFEILQKRGLIYQVQGSGTFVRRPKRDGYVNFLENNGFTSDLTDHLSKAKVIELEIITAPKEIQSAFKCGPEAFYHLKRIRYLNQRSLCIEESFYRKSIVPFINEQVAEGSMFAYIHQLGHNISFSDKYMRIRQLSAKEGALLDLPAASPTLEVHEIYYLASGLPFDYSFTTYNYQNSRFFIQSSTMD